jgi:hypothetical protein
MNFIRLLLVLAALVTALPAPSHGAFKMRPYSGIGVLQLSSASEFDPIPLYEDPGIARCCKIRLSEVRDLNAWLFGSEPLPVLLVTARKGNWFEVEHDDAGRTGWIRQEHSWRYTSWDQFLKGRLVSFLPNSPKPLIQMLPRTGATEGTPLAAGHPLKVILVQEDWAYVLLNQNSAGWIRWRDQDGRLLIGIARSK